MIWPALLIGIVIGIAIGFTLACAFLCLEDEDDWQAMIDHQKQAKSRELEPIKPAI
jgi:uncharacterized membrane-anchored protein YhcB (DUF1043 family)